MARMTRRAVPDLKRLLTTYVVSIPLRYKRLKCTPVGALRVSILLTLRLKTRRQLERDPESPHGCAFVSIRYAVHW
jgi:hypothetical protein